MGKSGSPFWTHFWGQLHQQLTKNTENVCDWWAFGKKIVSGSCQWRLKWIPYSKYNMFSTLVRASFGRLLRRFWVLLGNIFRYFGRQATILWAPKPHQKVCQKHGPKKSCEGCEQWVSGPLNIVPEDINQTRLNEVVKSSYTPDVPRGTVADIIYIYI